MGNLSGSTEIRPLEQEDSVRGLMFAQPRTGGREARRGADDLALQTALNTPLISSCSMPL